MFLNGIKLGISLNPKETRLRDLTADPDLIGQYRE